MIGSGNTVMLKLRSDGCFTEGVAGEAITPGMAVDLQSDNTWDKASVAGKLQAIARENDLVGDNSNAGTKSIDIDYAEDDNLLMFVPVSGDIVYMLSQDSGDIAIGAEVEIDATNHGCVKVQSAGEAIGIALEAKTSNTLDRIKIQIL